MTVAAVAIAAQLLGLLMDLRGVLLMANGYTRVVPGSQTVHLLASALRKGDLAREAVRHRELTAEDRLAVLRGLAWIGLGFLVQLLGLVLAMVA